MKKAGTSINQSKNDQHIDCADNNDDKYYDRNDN